MTTEEENKELIDKISPLKFKEGGAAIFAIARINQERTREDEFVLTPFNTLNLRELDIE